MTAHETSDDEHNLVTSSDRSFGLTIGIILLLIAIFNIYISRLVSSISLLLIVAGLLLVITGIIKPALLAPLNKQWTKLGLFLYKIVNPIVMFIIFVVTIIPIGLILRFSGKDVLSLKWEKSKNSYWVDRKESGPLPKNMEDQF
jgi:uncharacterized membrane protein HdeD (DUF308 family)